jgi:hypothetical protein
MAVVLAPTGTIAAFVPAVRARMAVAIARKPERITVAILPFTSAGGAAIAAVGDGLASSLSGRIARTTGKGSSLNIQVVDDHRSKPVLLRREDANGDVRSLEERCGGGAFLVARHPSGCSAINAGTHDG